MTASLIIAASEVDSNLYYACRFIAPDPFVFLQVGGRKVLLMSDLEVDRARQQARVDEVLSLAEWEAKAKQRWPQPRLTDTVSLLLEDYGARDHGAGETQSLLPSAGDQVRRGGGRHRGGPAPHRDRAGRRPRCAQGERDPGRRGDLEGAGAYLGGPQE